MSFDGEWSIARLRGCPHVDAAHADAVGRAAQTFHQVISARDDEVAEEMWSIAREASRATKPRLQRLRFVTITTDSPGSFAAWMRSLRGALDDSGWLSGRGPEVEVLRIANDATPSIDAAHRGVSAEGISIHVLPVDPGLRPLPLAEARWLAFQGVRSLEWIPSPRQPVWSLDEDFRFESLAPSPRSMFARRSGGPLFHRLDALVAQLGADGVEIIVGGNTDAAPVPSLGLLLGQIRDLTVAAETDDLGARSGGLEPFSSLPDGYYDLADVQAPELRIPLRRGWWREDGAIEWGEVLSRLRSGLPVTRPALATPLTSPPDAWAHHRDVSVAGGNTVLLSPRALEARFRVARCGEIISRRGDTTWCIDARMRGARVVRACLPLAHHRRLSPKSPAAAAHEALADALGVGVYRAMLTGDADDEGTVMRFTRARLTSLVARLEEAEATARELGARRGVFAELAAWIGDSRRRLILPVAKLSFCESSP